MIYKRGDFWHMDVTVNGVRYREALDTSDKREALRLEKERVKDILQGKGATLAGPGLRAETLQRGCEGIP